jgi:hypothetical protein
MRLRRQMSQGSAVFRFSTGLWKKLCKQRLRMGQVQRP